MKTQESKTEKHFSSPGHTNDNLVHRDDNGLKPKLKSNAGNEQKAIRLNPRLRIL